MEAIIFARVSTEEQKDANNSLPAQLHRLEEYCKRKGFEVVKDFSFDESAYKDKRDEFDKTLLFLEASKERIAVCFDKVDRLSRNIFDKRVSLLYEKALADKIELHFVSDGQVINGSISAGEQFRFGMNLGLAKYYSDATSDNVKRVFEQKRRRGEWTGNVPFGYENVPLDESKRLRRDIVSHPENADYLRKIFELYDSEDYSGLRIVSWLNQNKVLTNNGKDFHQSAVYHILGNPFYYGKMRTKQGLYDHKYEPLISKDLFDRVQKLRAKKNNSPQKTTTKDFAFGGLLKCAQCGCAITAEEKIKKSGKRYVYYSCTNGKRKCKRIYVNEDEFLKRVNKIFESIKLDDKQIQEIANFLKEHHQEQSLYHKKERELITKRIEKIDEVLDKALDLMIEGSITSDVYDKKMKTLQEEKGNLVLKFEEIAKADESYDITAKTVLNLAKRAQEIFSCSEEAEKRQLLRLLLQNPVLNGKKLEFTLNSPFKEVVNFNSSSNSNSLLRRQGSNLRPSP